MKIGLGIVEQFQEKKASQIKPLFAVLLGSFFLALMAQAAIFLPFTPVPVSLQTLGVALLVIVLEKRAYLAVFAYLLQATFGFPVLAGGFSNPLWIFSPKAGYLIAFVLSAYFTAILLKWKSKLSFWQGWFVFSVGEGLILLVGTIWLSLFVGMGQAIYMGFLPFIPGAILKITTAAAAYQGKHAAVSIWKR